MNRSQSIRKDELGFTLIELLVVIAVIALIGGIVASNVVGNFNRAKVETTKIQMKQIGVILNSFKLDCGFFPTTEQGLDALIHKPSGRECKKYDPEGYIGDKKIPKDGFDNDFIYISEGNKYTLKSLGNDGKEGGDGIDKDISTDDPEF